MFGITLRNQRVFSIQTFSKLLLEILHKDFEDDVKVLNLTENHYKMA